MLYQSVPALLPPTIATPRTGPSGSATLSRPPGGGARSTSIETGVPAVTDAIGAPGSSLTPASATTSAASSTGATLTGVGGAASSAVKPAIRRTGDVWLKAEPTRMRTAFPAPSFGVTVTLLQ